MCFFGSLPAQAGWSWNIGYHNPPGSLIGVNFMYLWTNWAVELGVGSIDSRTTSNNNDEETSQLSVAGDINVKYLFGSRWFRPYLQAGVGLGTSASAGSDTGVSASTGSGFFGAGIMLKGNPFYFYFGANALSRSTEFNLGIGFDF